MPTYLPGGHSEKMYAEKLTLRGKGVEGLVEVIDSYIPEDATSNQLATVYAKEIFEFLTADDFPKSRTPIYEYLPEHYEDKNYAERLTLRGSEVDALREIISKVDRNSISFDAAVLVDFVMYKMRNEPVHIEQLVKSED